MPNFDIACVESRIQGPRDYYSKFTIGPLRGQRTRTNARTRRGSKKTVAGKKK